MTRLIELLISLLIVAALFLLVALVLPSSRNLEEKIETNRKLSIVFDTLNSFHRFKDWNALPLHDPSMSLRLSGPDSGVGAQLDFSSSNSRVGSGTWKISKSEPDRSVTYDITDIQRGTNKQSVFTLKPTGQNNRNVQITQDYHVDYGFNLMGRYAGLYVRSHVGEDMKIGLQRLTNMLASVPNYDYRVQGSSLTNLRTADRPAEDLLVVNAGSIDRDNDKIKAAMKSDLEWIKRTMDANGLSSAGPVRIVTSELGTDTYTFDVVQPVRKGGGTKPAADEPADANADKNAGDKATADATAPVQDATPVTAGSPLQVKIPAGAPVTYLQTKPTKVAIADYAGYMAELDAARNALRAWATTQGYEPTDRPYEIYLNGIDNAFTANGKFQVFWTLKQ